MLSLRAFGAVLGGMVTSGVGVIGVWLGLHAMFGSVHPVAVDWLLPLSGVRLELDPLGGFFVALTGVVAVPVGCYAIGYARRARLSRVTLALLPVFVAAMELVPAAGSVTTFLLAWELMAIASLILVLSEHTRSQVRAAGLSYAVMTQLGFVAILVGLMVLSAAGGSIRLADLTGVSGGARTAVFVLTFVGFGSKAGLVPLHAWLPRAHPEAPSPVSALMSAAMVNLGIYGIVRFDLRLLGPGPRWWGLVLMAVGAISALYGVLQASVATDIKRLLAYSTTENMGLVVLALGAATLFADTGDYGPATIAAAAAVVHLMAHAAFKSLGFLAAGSVLAATHLRDLDRLGGLARRMPYTTVFFGVAALGACGLPLGAGFVGEWLLVQSLVHAPPAHDRLVALTTPSAVGVVALATGLSVAAMVKAFGIGFLARPRSSQAADASEAPNSMRAAMMAAASACLVLAVAPGLVAPIVRQTVAALPFAPAGFTGLGTVVRLPGLPGSIAPGVIAAGAVSAALVAAGLAGLRSRRRPPPVELPLWACGADDLTERMQYTATSFAEPLQRVFGDVLRPDTDIEVTQTAESRFIADRIAYRTAIADAIEQRLYTPVVAAVAAAAGLMRRAHTGSVHLYLAYGALGVLIVLVAAK
ncbi:proton-conducting transporter membrane subunit [Mycobacterium simiae]|uniref:proton-conducting transporter transmembrane domain-containing protein n=1 Tax=Mycobacterium simiae TaxID=1784 RepID=UPI0005CABC16|nr:proton-conducting transporter membrane subunit [Mycobacterium simiae]BBX42485.1 oxidoreductase [Mycobacterium simiae]